MTSRRLFIKSGALAMLSLGFAPRFLARAAAATGNRRRLLIAIFQRGAVDGLNMVVPFGEAEYYKVRPTIAIPHAGEPNGAIDLDGFFGLHPRMAPLRFLWDNRSLAVVHACGSPDHTRSHFDAQDYIESATPGVKNTRDGWMNRYLQVSSSNRNPLRGVSLTRRMPRSLQGEAPVLAMGRVDEFGVGGDSAARASFEAAYSTAADAVLRHQATEAFEAMRTLRRATPTYRQAASIAYPRSPFGQALQEIARLAKSDVGLEIAFAESTNWDHHVNEGGATGLVAARLDDLSRSIAALIMDLGNLMTDIVILTMSEFGRAVAENGNRGTDHGHGNAMLVIGGPVEGGKVYGRWPGLTVEQRFEGRDLAVTTDFRDVFTEIVDRHLGAAPAALASVFPGYSANTRLGIIKGE
jgi:uncharacterized protein (DUF1501 family)